MTAYQQVLKHGDTLTITVADDPVVPPVNAPSTIAQAQALLDKGGTYDWTGMAPLTGTLTLKAAGTKVTGLNLRGPQFGKTVNFVGQQHGLVVNAKACVVKSASIAGFGHSGIWAEGGEGVFIDACVIEDCGYSGVILLSDVNGRVTNNTIRRIGMTGTGPSSNAYGISTTLVNGAVPKGTYIGANVIEDVPYFHGLDAHSGDDILFEGNTVRRCARGLFITTGGVPKPEPRSNRVQSVGNRYELKGWTQKPTGQNAVAETWYMANAAKSTNNAIGSSYPVAVYNLSSSSTLTETGTTRFPE